MSLIDRYNKVKRFVSDSQMSNARLEGKLEALKDELEAKGFKTIKQAEKYLEEKEIEIGTLKDEIEKKLDLAEEKIRRLQ